MDEQTIPDIDWSGGSDRPAASGPALQPPPAAHPAKPPRTPKPSWRARLDPWLDHTDRFANLILTRARIPLLLCFLGVFVGLLGTVISAFSSAAEGLAPGSRGIPFSFFVMFLGAVWQFSELHNVFLGKGTRLQRIIVSVALLASITGFAYVLFTQLQYADRSPFAALFAASLSGGIVGALVITTLMLGKVTTGLAVGVALHNVLNGARFDLSAFYELFLDQAIPDVVGVLVTAGAFLLSFVTSKT